MNVTSKCLVLAIAAVVCPGADRKPAPIGKAGNDKLEISATLLPGKDAIKEEVGSDLNGYFTVVRVTVTPKAGQKLMIARDEFLLRTDRDGQRSQPFAPSQIAGRGAIVVAETSSGGVAADNAGPVWGGIPGTGYPQRMPGQGGAMGNTGSATSLQTSSTQDAKTTANPLLATLKAKVLPEQETDRPLSGLLYFQLDGKQKTKDLELLYKGPAGRLSIRFR
jgi:hypothetical protein